MGSSKTPEPRLTLKFAGQKSSSVEDKTPTSVSIDNDSLQKQDPSRQHSALSTTRDIRETPDSTRLGGLGQGSPMPAKIISPSPSQTPMPSTTGASLPIHSSIGGADQMSNSWTPGNAVAPHHPIYPSVDMLFRKPTQSKTSVLPKLPCIGTIRLMSHRCVRCLNKKPYHKITSKLGPSTKVSSVLSSFSGRAPAVTRCERSGFSELPSALTKYCL